MNADPKADPFAGLMTRRVEPLTLVRSATDADGNTVKTSFSCELHELPLGEFLPLRDRFMKGDMTEGEFLQRVLGEALVMDGQKLTYERAQLVPTGTLKELQPILEKIMGLSRPDAAKPTADAKVMAKKKG